MNPNRQVTSTEKTDLAMNVYNSQFNLPQKTGGVDKRVEKTGKNTESSVQSIKTIRTRSTLKRGKSALKVRHETFLKQLQ